MLAEGAGVVQPGLVAPAHEDAARDRLAERLDELLAHGPVAAASKSSSRRRRGRCAPGRLEPQQLRDLDVGGLHPEGLPRRVARAIVAADAPPEVAHAEPVAQHRVQLRSNSFEPWL